jgi:uncharacterized protein (TIGR02588 family)
MKRLGEKVLDKNTLESWVFGVALLLVLGVLGYLIREALTAVDGPPDVVVAVGETRAGAGGYLVPIRVENKGGGTAEQLQVRVRLESPGGDEEAVLLIPYLPREAVRSGWVTFRGDPRAGAVRVAGVAYQSP